MSLVYERATDIQIALDLPLFQPFKDGQSICLAVSEKPITRNSLRDMLSSAEYLRSEMRLPIALGYGMRGEMRFADLSKMPHAMYAGSSNSGKSVGLQCLILSLIAEKPVSKVNLIIFDVGAYSMDPLAGVPHLSHPIVKDAATGRYVIQRLEEEMEWRIKLDLVDLRKLPAIVCVIDEYVSLITNIGNKKLSEKLANSITNLLRRGRHAKIHMVLATQNPTTKNMKVDIGNITTRLAFACANYHNSITILGESGAEKLPGKGAMLFKSNEYPESIYLQGAYISSDKIRQLVDRRIASASRDTTNKFIIPEMDLPQKEIFVADSPGPESTVEDRRKELADIILWALGRDSISKLQVMQQFRMGNRADAVLDELHRMSLIADQFAKQPRPVVPTCIGDVSDAVKAFLSEHSVSADDIVEALRKRSTQEHTDER